MHCKPWYDLPHEVLHLAEFGGATLGKLGQPDLPLAVPIVEHFQPIHHVVHPPIVIMRRQVVNAAIQNLAWDKGTFGESSYRE